MRIGFVFAGPPSWSETFLVRTIRGLQQRGFHVCLFLQRGRADLGPDIPVFSARWDSARKFPAFAKNMALLLRKPGRIRRFLRCEKQLGRTLPRALANLAINLHILPAELDWVHYPFSTHALKRESVAPSLGARMALSARGFDVATSECALTGGLKPAFHRADKIHCISKDIARLAERAGAPAERIILIPPAIDLPAENPVWQKVPGSILTACRLVWKKGLLYALQAMARLQAQGKTFSYCLVGDGPEEEHLRFLVLRWGLAERVSFAGRKSPQEVQQLMASADIYLQPSVQEGFCNAVLEAQAQGCLCLVSDAEGLGENIEPGVTGFQFARRNARELSMLLVRALEMTEEEKGPLRKAGRSRVERHFAMPRQLDSFQEFYRESSRE